jgi:mono/diheme cytochrome c family protein
MRKSFLNWGIGVALLVAGSIAVGLSACAGASLRLPTAEELAPAVTVRQVGDVEALRRGRAVYVTECAACHRLYSPADYSPEQWPGIVARMARRASLAGDQAADLLLYLLAAACAEGEKLPVLTCG